ncbi:methyltransferase domain-containing protein [Crepidotus variabilis]|uniref:Methyltransferase domain-containing protein n=1 Tax=Crepidotus variabilis TaxID=179855 RepID=A0A9P6JJW3_9AGAR|nr:methyltransferase domain-containing protein [Crepidotus variabilis]
MSLPFARHPRFTIFVVLALCGVFYLLSPGPAQYGYLSRPWKEYDGNLPARMERAHDIYDKLLKDRQGLIKKHGPHPKDIVNFPPDVAPWPPYTVWDYFPAAFNCPHEVDRLGALGDGGKWICGISRLARKRDCVVYSFGINYESSFEAQILGHTQDCQIYGYDFSVKSFGPEIPSNQAHRTHFHAFGLSGSDKHGPDDNPPMYTLESLMKMNGHKHIDLLKIDIEGWEFETLTTLLKPYVDSGEPLPFGQLSLEIHLWDKSFEYFLGWWEMLEAAGLRPFWTEPNLVYLIYNKKGTPDLAEYSFLNVKGDNIFIKDPPPPSRHPHGPA